LPSRRKRGRRVPWFFVVPAAVLAVVIVGIVAYSVSQAPQFPLPCLENEGLYLHVHPYLRIVISGQNVTIPTAIGISNPVIQEGLAGGGPNSCFEPLHTHDSSGIIHIESTTQSNYTLEEFFAVWSATYHTVVVDGVKHPIVFNSTDILGFKADASHKVMLLVDGKPSTAFGSLELVSLDYCSTQDATVAPCYPTAAGNPAYGTGDYPFGTGHTIEIEYVSS
jgi:hypothetical protein